MRWAIATGVVSLLFIQIGTAQDIAKSPIPDDAFWAAHWAEPKRSLFGLDEQSFYENVHDIMFPWNEHDEPSNPGALDENANWLKDHPNVYFFIDGYASSRGEWVYNLRLSQRRADWVRDALVARGISSDRMLLSVGWGQLYPVCPERNDACWSKNRLVRLVYSPLASAAPTGEVDNDNPADGAN